MRMGLSRLGVIGLLGITVWLLPTVALAQPFVGVNGDTCKWDTLTEAVAEASDGDRVFVAAGTFTENGIVVDKSLSFESASADCQTTSNVLTTVDGTNTPGGIFLISPPGRGGLTVLFSNFSLINGNGEKGGALFINRADVTLLDSRMSNSAASDGGCAFIEDGSLTMDDSNASFCSATGDGGAFFVAAGSLRIANNSFIQNGSIAGRNGGGVAAFNSEVSLTDSSMANNNAANGGGFYLANGSTLTIANSTMTSNDATNLGGGLYSENSTINLRAGTEVTSSIAAQEGGGLYLADSALDATNAIISNNTAQGEGGGGIRGVDSTLDLSDSSIVGNAGTFDGGGIWLSGDDSALAISGGSVSMNQTTTQQTNRGGGGIFAEGDFAANLSGVTVDSNDSSNIGGGVTLKDGVDGTIDQCVFNNNSSSSGGAIHVFGSQTMAVIDRSDFTGNSASLSGGAIQGFAGGIDVSRTDFLANTANSGGAISSQNAPQLTISDSLFDGNTATSAAGRGGAVQFSRTFSIIAVDEISESTFTNNQSNLYGGAIAYLGDDGDEDALAIANSSFTSNTTGESGGAVHIEDAESLQIDGGSFDQNSTTVQATNQGGGALYAVSSGSISVSDVEFLDNFSENLGGALAIRNSTLILNGGLVDGNDSGLGGGLYQGGGRLFARSTVFSTNTAPGSAGGGSIYISGCSGFDMSSVTIMDSSAPFGGGMRTSFCDGTINNSRVIGNTATDSGGGLYFGDSEVTIRAVATGEDACLASSFSANTYCSEIRDNSATESGGGIKVTSVSTSRASLLDLQGVALVDNQAGMRGAAIDTERFASGVGSELRLSNTLVSGHSNDTEMIEAISLNDLATATIDSTTIAGNFGAALIANGPDATLDLANTILWDNDMPSFASLTGTTTNLLGCNYSEPEQASSWNLGSTVDPIFVTDPDRGDYRLDPINSPLIDVCIDGPIADLDGFGRPGGAAFEPGAFEVAGQMVVELVTVSPTDGLTTTEAGETAMFEISLQQAPLSDVVIPVLSDDVSEGTVGTVGSAELTFTPENWDQPQVVIVTGADDASVDGDQPYTISLGPTSSGDAAYQGIALTGVMVTNEDDDNAGVVVMPTAGLVTTEAGSTAQFTVRLLAAPLQDVTVAVASNDGTEGTTDTSELTFTTANWDQPQTVTVTGVDDALVDGDQAYAVDLGPTVSGDANFNALTVPSVALTNTDDDEAPTDELIFMDGFE